MEADLIALMLADAPLSALVGTRIHFNILPQGVVGLSVVMHLISGVPDYTLKGPSGLVASRIQMDIRGTRLVECWAVRDAIEALLSGYKGTHGLTVFQGIFKLSERQSFERSAGTPGFHRISLDFDVRHHATS